MLKIHAFLLLSATFLSGCGGGGDSASPSPAAATTNINQFSLAGNVTASSISVSKSAGQFAMTWDVSSSDPFHIDVYLSSDAVVSTDDKSFIGGNCGALSLYNCKAQQTVQCNVTKVGTTSPASYTLGCQGLGTSSQVVTLPSITLPFSANILFKACNALQNSCVTVSKSVTLVS
jgi:hypothetical protein